MAGSATAAGGAGTGTPVAAGGNPFQLVTNLYAEKNNTGSTTSYTVTASQSGPQGGQVNAGNFLRRVNLILRTTTIGTTATGATVSDMPWNVFTGVDMVNVDGSEILYTMGGYAHYLVQKYGRPWLGDPAQWQDAANSTASLPQCTLPLMPEIRWTAGVLANTDTRSQYRIDYIIDSMTNYIQSGTTNTTGAPIVNVQPYLDAWAQPDATDLQGTPNQPVPPGLNLQNKRRHQIFSLNSASDNILQSALTGNALRLQILVIRSGAAPSNTRYDGVTDPLTWQLDNRSLGKYSSGSRLLSSTTTLVNGTTVINTGGDMLNQRATDFYDEYFATSPIINNNTTNSPLIATAYATFTRDIGVYVFPRFLKPGTLYGEGWLYTANSTKEIFEFTATTLTSGTAELITDEVYPVGPVDPSLTDI